MRWTSISGIPTVCSARRSAARHPPPPLPRTPPRAGRVPSVSMEEMDPFAQAVTRLSDEGLALEISGRTFRLVDPVRGDAGAAALRMLGMVQAAAPVGIATHGSTQVAAAVWAPPRLFLARWSRNRWVVGYRLTAGSRPNDYVRI